MSLLVYYVTCVTCISKKLKYLKTEARESMKLKDNVLTLLFEVFFQIRQT